MEQSTILYGDSVVGYHFLKRGHALVVCLHGYDENGGVFGMLKDLLPAGYSLLAIDLPWHGNTKWSADQPFDVTALWEITRQIKKLQFPETIEFSLLGFSLGGRLALGMMEAAPVEISGLTLLAPDGLRMSAWYRFATRSVAGRALFRFTVTHPSWLLICLKLGTRLRIINQSIYKFTTHYLGTEALRRQLYNRWMTTRFIHPNVTAVANNIIRAQIPVTLIYGSYDRIMPARKGEHFCRKLGKFCTVTVLACGHQILQPKNKKHLMKVFRENKIPGE